MNQQDVLKDKQSCLQFAFLLTWSGSNFTFTSFSPLLWTTFHNSNNQMCFKPGGQILLLSILLHRNSYKKCCKKWIFLTAFWRRALCSKRHQVTWRPFSIYGSGAVTFKCKCDTSKTTWDMKTYWDVIVITEDTDLASKPGFCACSGGLLQASSSLSSIPRGSAKMRQTEMVWAPFWNRKHWERISIVWASLESLPDILTSSLKTVLIRNYSCPF